MRAAKYVKTLIDCVPIICLCAPGIQTRKDFKAIVDVFEVYVKCPVEVCSVRDPKGLYAKYHKGEIKNMIGYDIPYQEYNEADLVVDTSRIDLEASVKLIQAFLPEYHSRL